MVPRMDELRRLIADMALNAPATRESIDRVEAAVGFQLPPDYVAFLLEHDGGEGSIGSEGYGVFHPVDELPSVQEGNRELEHFAEWLIFGTNGSGEAWVFAADGTVLMVPFLGNKEDAIPQGSFVEFVRRIGAGRAFERQPKD